MHDDGLKCLSWSRIDWSVLIVLLLLALATRAWQLGDGSFRVDEYYTVYKAEQRATSLFNPAYNALAHMSFRLFGVSEGSARLPAMILGVLGIPLIYAMWRGVLGRFAATVAALITLVSSWHLWHSQFARYYSGTFLFGAATYYLLFQAVRRGSLFYFAGGLLALLIGVAFHAATVVLAAAFAVYCVLLVVAGRAKLTTGTRRVVTIYLILCGMGLLAVMPIGWRMAADWHAAGQQWGYGPFGLLLQTTKYLQIPVAICGFLGALLLLRDDFRTGSFFVVGVGVPLAALLVGSAATSVRPDYLFYCASLIFLSAGYACAVAFRANRGRLVAGLALTVVVLSSMVPEMASHYSGRASLHIQDVVAFLDRQYQPEDRVMALVSGVDHYSDGRFQLEKRPGTASDSAVDWKGVLDPYLESDGRLWIVVPAKRSLPTGSLEFWLRKNAQLRWRKYERRYDYTYRGYEVFLVVGSRNS